MKKTALLIIALFAVTAIAFAQDQTINGNLLQQLNNQWLSPAKLQLGRSNTDIIENKAVIGVTNGNLHVDSYPGYALCLNYYQKDSNSGNKGLTISPNGNVGIGTSTPDGAAKLDVKGRIHAEEYSIEKNVPALMYAYWDMFTHGGRKLGHYSIGWYDDPSFVYAPTLKMTAWGGIKLFTEGQERVSILHNGAVGIGTENPTEKLDVAGTIRAKEVKIEATGWSDFVFDKNYNLPKLSDVEKHINDNRHLPGIPSEKEVLENGVNVVDMQARLLQKIEELTLYVIEQDKKIEEQNKRIKELENR